MNEYYSPLLYQGEESNVLCLQECQEIKEVCLRNP